MTKRAEELLAGERGGLIMIEGDAGLGKSRLLEEFKGPAIAAARTGAAQTDLLIFSGKGDAGRSGQVPPPQLHFHLSRNIHERMGDYTHNHIQIEFVTAVTRSHETEIGTGAAQTDFLIFSGKGDAGRSGQVFPEPLPIQKYTPQRKGRCG
jgi:hypothetical protein